MNMQVEKVYDSVLQRRVVVRLVDNQVVVVRVTPTSESTINLFPSDELNKQIGLANRELAQMSLYAPARKRQIAVCLCLCGLRDLIQAHNRIVDEWKQEGLL